MLTKNGSGVVIGLNMTWRKIEVHLLMIAPKKMFYYVKTLVIVLCIALVEIEDEEDTNYSNNSPDDNPVA